MKFIAQAILTTAALLALWHLVLSFMPSNLNTTQHQWNDNIITAQEYLFSEDIQHKEVIVGSSLSKRLVKEFLPNNIVNLSFSGQSVFDGLLIISRSPKKPKKVYIEMNVILRKENERFQNHLFSPHSYYAKKHLPALQEKNQPVGILKGLVFQLLKNSEDPETNKKNEHVKVPTINAAMLNIHRQNYSIPPTTEVLKTALQKLRVLVTELEQDDVAIVFFEMPVHAELCDSPFSKAIRESFQEEFPKDRYSYIDQPNCREYHTTDGHHLSKASAAQFSNFLKNQIDNIQQSPLRMSSR